MRDAEWESSGTKESATWHSAARQAPTLTSNGLIARNVRTGQVWRVPTKAMEALRGLPALSPSLKPAVLARRQAASRAISGAVSLEIARQLGALAHDSSGRVRASEAKGFEGHVRGPAGLGSVCAQAVVVLLVLNGLGTPSADAATAWVVSKYEFPPTTLFLGWKSIPGVLLEMLCRALCRRW